jgi:hypothetical protein
MSKKYSWEWECLSDWTERLETPNGWVLKQGNSYVCFVPDPKKEWVLDDTD